MIMILDSAFYFDDVGKQPYSGMQTHVSGLTLGMMK